jgi:hypothetical protein
MNIKEQFSSPLFVYAAYMLGSLLIIAGYRWFFPGAAEPLEPFFLKWRFAAALIEFAALYPALAFSALVIPFGLKEHSGAGYAGDAFVGDKSFSPRFLQYLTWPVITACAAAAVYGVVFFLLLPAAGNMKQSMVNRAGLFKSALEKARACAAAGEWAEASRFIAIGEGIWPGSREINRFKDDYGISAYRARIQEETAAGPEDGKPLGSVDAMRQAEAAFAEERWYDAHWLATLAERLARPGSAEIPAAHALASRAWNKIAELEPNAREKERYNLYRLKRNGYNAILEQDWINAYYTFKELSVLTPQDPDVERYLADSTVGLAGTAFFVDEIDLALGAVSRNPVFSLPADSEGGGRIVIRFSAMALLPDYSYVWEPELVAVDGNGLFLYRARSDYGKIIPVLINTLEGEPKEQTALLLRALDRVDGDKRRDPDWTDETGEAIDSRGSQILLNLNFDTFILLARAGEGLDNLSLRELFDAEKTLGAYGFVPEVFRAEILRRLSEPVFFLPLSVLALFLGWHFRARKKPRYVYVPMLGVLPLVFYHASLFLRSVFNNLAIWLSLSIGFQSALVCFVAASAVCFILTLVVLAAQHG